MSYKKESEAKRARRRMEEELKKKFDSTPLPGAPGGVPIQVDKNTVIYKKKKP